MNYLPVPVGIPYRSQTDSWSFQNGCKSKKGTGTHSITKSIHVPPSTVEQQYEPIVVRKFANRPRDGKWKEIRESGQIKMTPMSAVDEVVENYLGSIVHHVVEHEHWVFGTHVDPNTCRRCTLNGEWRHGGVLLTDSYIEQGDLSYWRNRFRNAPYIPLTGEIDKARLEKAKAEAYAELFQAYNLGEEIYELRESLMTIFSLLKRGAKMIADAKSMYDSLKRKGLHKQAMESWMEFRYGIMPIVYSIQDVMALLDETGVYRTVRKRVSADAAPSKLPGPKSTYFYEVGAADISASITTKGRWATTLAKQRDLININPITTALEVYPWAMVIRWFVNVSSFAGAQIKSLTTSATEFSGCVAFKETSEIDVFLHYYSDDRVHVVDPGDSECGVGFFGPKDYGIHGEEVLMDVKLRSISKNNYIRETYQPSDTKFVWSPYFDWKRIVDGLILSHGQVSKLLRAIR